MPTARFKPGRAFAPPAPTKGSGRAPRTGARRNKPSLDFESIPCAKPAPMPAIIAPQLATRAKAPPAGTAWVHEMKYDGYRMLCRIDHRGKSN